MKCKNIKKTIQKQKHDHKGKHRRNWIKLGNRELKRMLYNDSAISKFTTGRPNQRLVRSPKRHSSETGHEVILNQIAPCEVRLTSPEEDIQTGVNTDMDRIL